MYILYLSIEYSYFKYELRLNFINEWKRDLTTHFIHEKTYWVFLLLRVMLKNIQIRHKI